MVSRATTLYAVAPHGAERQQVGCSKQPHSQSAVHMADSSEEAGENPPRAQYCQGDKQPVHRKDKQYETDSRHNVEITEAAPIWSTKEWALARVRISFSAVKQWRRHSRGKTEMCVT